MGVTANSGGCRSVSPAHHALFYRSEAELVRATRAFVEQGIEAREPVMVAVPTEQLEVLRREMGATEDVVRYEDMTVLGRNPGCILPMLFDWMDSNPRPMRVIGSSMWPGRGQAEIVEVMRHEALLNLAFAEADARILCLYDAARLDADALEVAKRTHRVIVLGDSLPCLSEHFLDPMSVYLAAGQPLPAPTAGSTQLPVTDDLRLLRALVMGSETASTLSGERRADLMFSVNEAATNAIKHGGSPATVKLWRDGPMVVAEVHDNGRIADPFAGRRPPSRSASQGRGLWLINQLCDLVEVRSDDSGTTIRMHMHGAVG